MRRIPRLDRYVFTEIVGPTVLGFLVYTSILLIRFLFRSAEMIIRKQIPAADVGMLVVFTLPNIVVLTIPMSFLFGILVAIGRLSADSELIAMRSCGVSLFSLYRPILALSLLLTLATGGLMIGVLPHSNHAYWQLLVDLITRNVAQQVEPREFYEDWEGLVLYVFEIPPGGQEWRGIFLADDDPKNENQVTVARSGRVRVEDGGERVVLEMRDATTHEVDFRDPSRYHIKHWDRLEQILQDRTATAAEERTLKKSSSKAMRSMTLSELAERRDSPEASDNLRNLAAAEAHKRFAIPVACLVFGLLALPLGFGNPRGGKSSSFVLSIGVILLYYVLLSNGEEMARVGRLRPWLAMWLPNLLLTAAGLVLLTRRNADKSLIIGRLNRWLAGRIATLFAAMRHKVRARRQQRRADRRRRPRSGGEDERAQVVLRLPRLRLRFPNILDRYVIRLFAWTFCLVTLSAVSVYVISDLTETVEEILNNQVPFAVVLDYYKYLSVQIFFEIAPILVLLTTLVTFSLLSRTNEVTATKSLGISLYRLSVPAVAAALAVALLCGFLESFVLPASNARVAQLKDRIEGRETPRTYSRAARQWLFGQGRYIYNYLYYDTRQQLLHRLQVFEFDDGYEMTRRLLARQARYVDERWIFSDAWSRTFAGRRTVGFSQFDDPVVADYPETPAYFESEVRGPDQMSYVELREHIHELKNRGQAVPELEVELHEKVAFPVVSLVMALVALPFAFRIGRRGTLYGIGVAVVLGMIFLGVYAFFATLGQTAALPPLVAVWAPSVLFGALSVYLFLGIRT